MDSNDLERLNKPKYFFDKDKNFTDDNIPTFILGQSEDKNLEKALISQHLNKYGYLLLKQNQPYSKALMELFCPIFGDIIIQNFGYKDTFDFQVSNNKNSKIIAKTNQTQSMHTDSGFAIKVPKIVLLFCQQQSTNGGFSQIVKSQDIYNYLLKFYPVGIEALSKINAVTFVKKEKLTVKSILSLNDEKECEIDFSTYCNEIHFASSEAQRAYRMIWGFAHHEKNQVKFRMQPNDILIIDNKRCLHGRTEFPEDDPRVLKRVWYDGKVSYLNTYDVYTA